VQYVLAILVRILVTYSICNMNRDDDCIDNLLFDNGELTTDCHCSEARTSNHQCWNYLMNLLMMVLYIGKFVFDWC